MLSGRILTYNPVNKSFIPRGKDGKFTPKNVIQSTVQNKQGIVKNKPQAPPGPVILTQKTGNRP